MLMFWLATQGDFSATDTAQSLTVWLVLVATILGVGGALLALGRRIITGPIALEAKGMSDQLGQITKQVAEMARVLAQVVTDLAVVKDRQEQDRQEHIAHRDQRRNDDD